jgi:hypothetical protein
MNESLAPPDRRTCSAVRRLLVAVDRSVEAVREVEKARAALERESTRSLRLYCVPDDRNNEQNMPQLGGRFVEVSDG